MMAPSKRTIAAAVIAPIMAVTGFRFSKEWRHAERGLKAWTYRILSTVYANSYADRIIDAIRGRA